MEKKEIAKQIIEAVGGAENVASVGHCMTRLRFNLKDNSKANDAIARQIEGVKGVSKAGGQYQLIIGSGIVDEYFDAINGIATFSKEDYSGVKNANVFDIVIDVLSGSMMPWLGCLMGSLIIQALLSLFAQIGVLDAASSTYLFFNTMSGACVYTMPIFIGFTCAEKLGTNKYMGALIGAIMIYPAMMTAISEGTVSVFGLSIQNFSYTGTFIPVVLSCILLKYVEKLAKKICPKVIYIFGVTMIELIIVVPLTFLVVGPVGNLITSGLTSLIMWLHGTAGFLAPAVVTMLLPFCVMGGLHVGLLPIINVMIAEVGYDTAIMPSFLAWNVGAAGIALAYALRNKEMNKRSLGFSAALSGVMGISEPTLFGVVLSGRKTLIATLVGMFLSGALIGIVNYKVTVPISQSVFSIPAAAGIDGNMMACAIGFFGSIIINFVVTYFFLGKEDK